VQAAGEAYEFLAPRREVLETICIVSHLTVARSDVAEPALHVRVERAPGKKCQRCWNYRASVGDAASHPELCARCVGVLLETQ